MSKINWIITDHNITVNYNGITNIIARDSKLSEDLIAAIKEGRMEEIPELVSHAKRIEKMSEGEFVVEEGKIFIRDWEVPTVLGNKIVKFSEEGLPFKPLVKFAEKLRLNPSFRAVSELFQFLEKNDHPITENGNFIAYKRVKADFKDIYSGTFDNSPGNILEMPRNQVDEDPNITCSNGYHVASWHYAHTQFASYDSKTDIMLEVEVNPMDVVAVPVDYDNSKIRVSRYKVLGVIDSENSNDVHIRYTSANETDPCPSSFASSCDEDDCCNHEEDEYPFEDELDGL